MDKGAGIDLFKKIGDNIAEGEPLYRIHACFQSDYGFAVKYVGGGDGYSIGDGI